jgi:hypothetical protein
MAPERVKAGQTVSSPRGLVHSIPAWLLIWKKKQYATVKNVFLTRAPAKNDGILIALIHYYK